MLKRLAPFVFSIPFTIFSLAMAYSSFFLLAKRKRDMSGHTPLSLII